MKILQRLALDATRNTPLQAACQGHFLAEHLSTLVAADFIPYPALDPRRDPPLPWLKAMCRVGTGTKREPRHGIVDVLGRLLVEGEPYEAEIPLRAIVGVTASQAENRMDLDSLPETMRLADGETFGPLPDTEMHRLREAVIQEFPLRHGAFRVDLQRWNGAYVAGNQGSSRRFALWRRLSQLDPYPVTVPAVVTPHDLDAHALHALRSRWRLIYAHADGALGAVMDARRSFPTRSTASAASHRRGAIRNSGWCLTCITCRRVWPSGWTSCTAVSTRPACSMSDGR